MLWKQVVESELKNSCIVRRVLFLDNFGKDVSYVEEVDLTSQYE